MDDDEGSVAQGDRLNFGLAAERAKLEGFKVDMVVVADDCALPPPLGVAGRRGLAGTLFVHKCAGGAAAAGRCLKSTTLEAREAAAAVGTMGVATSAHSLPGASAPARVIPEGEMEMGLGIHGEPGAFNAPAAKANEVVAQLLEKITDKERGYMSCLETGEGKVAVMVNSLGATPPTELHVAARAARLWLKYNGLNPVRTYVGSFMTALNMTGFSITLCKIDQLRLARLDHPVGCPAWPAVARTPSVPAPMPPAGASDAEADTVQAAKDAGLAPKPPTTPAGIAAKAAIVAAANALIDAEAELTEADTKVGDGDCGTTHARGARALLEDVERMPLDDDPAGLLLALGMTVRRSMVGVPRGIERAQSVSRIDNDVLFLFLSFALSLFCLSTSHTDIIISPASSVPSPSLDPCATGGTSGALYDIFFSAAAASVKDGKDGPLSASHPATWVIALEAGNAAMMKYGGAKAGDRTMLDALLPAAKEARKMISEDASEGTAATAAAAAITGALATCEMTAGAGRSSYVPAEVLKTVADPGATAAAAWIGAIALSLASSSS